MSELSRNLRDLARDSLTGVKTRRRVSSYFKKAGFVGLGKGAWLGFRNPDIVSGFVVEGSPLDTYVATFVLPAFDKLAFVSWSLGRRVAHLPAGTSIDNECVRAIAVYRSEIGAVQSSSDLIHYLRVQKVTGHYPYWVRYICYLRTHDFESAAKYLDADKRSKLHAVQIERLREIEAFVLDKNAAGVDELFRRWSESSQKIFGPLECRFSALRDH